MGTVPEVVDEYTELYRRDDCPLPPVEVFKVAGRWNLIDGFHRLEAAVAAGRETIEVAVAGSGTIDDCIWRAVGANQAHGVRRSNADKRRAVTLALANPRSEGLSTRLIAEHIGVSHELVRQARAREEVSTADSRAPNLPESHEPDRPVTRVKGRDGKWYPARQPISHRPDYESDEWYTPPEIIQAARKVMGSIDLDPASCFTAQQTVQATHYFDKERDGLREPWRGNVWLNPPFSRGSEFGQKLRDEIDAKRVSQAVVIQNASTATKWFHTLAPICWGCFPRGRLSFLRADGTRHDGNRHAQVLLYFGDQTTRFRSVFAEHGLVWRPV